MLITQEIIRKKRDKNNLSKEEIEFMVDGFVKGSIPDYQMSALAMAIFLNGFDPNETASLLNAMIASGVRYDWTKYKGSRTFVDKHSTGGVGDKTSLIILPLLVADGLDVPMISGRGLGHTGGTLDKLESIPGFKTRVDTPTFLQWMDRFHGAFGAQTEEFVPADKKLYALRDVTATVESRPLITASIMSKKLGEGLNGLILDVKFGSGAFMQEYKEAYALAQAMVAAGRAAGCSCVAAMTNMDEPLGSSAGNTLEVAECLDIMSDKGGPQDTKELSLRLAAGAAIAARGEHGSAALDAAYARMTSHLSSGRAYDIFCKIAVNQGANSADIERRNTRWINGESITTSLLAKRAGIVSAIKTRNLGIAILELGGGRKRTDDTINPYVGLSAYKKVGEPVGQGEQLCQIHHMPGQDISSVKHLLESSFIVDDKTATPEPIPLIKEWIWGY